MRVAVLPSLLFVAFALAPAAHANGLQPLSEDELGQVTGQEGILASLEYYYNSDPIPDGDFGPGRAIEGFCSEPGTSGSLANMNCRLALQLENREDEWLVFKNGHASLVVTRLSLDAAYLGDGSAAQSGYAGFFNEDKFRDVDGTCLLGAGNCNVEYVASMPGVRLHYPQNGGSYDPVTGESSGFNDVRFGLFFEGLAVEYNSPGVQDAWAKNERGSFMGARIADNNGHQAGITFGGDVYMFGF